MKIVHIHLLGPYTDGWGYQENVLPEIQVRQGHDVTVIANQKAHRKDGTIMMVDPGEYKINGVKIIRINYKEITFSDRVNQILFYYPVLKYLEELKPDIVLLHGLGNGLLNCQVKKYIKKHPECQLFGDVHAFEGNNQKASGFKAHVIKKIHDYFRKSLYPYYKAVLCITQQCLDYAKNIYDVPQEKLVLFPLGFDPGLIDWEHRDEIRKEFREKHSIGDNEIVIAHGGKIIPRRKTEMAIDAVCGTKHNVKMIVFGAIDDSIRNRINEKIAECEGLIYLNHLSKEEYIKVFLASDIALFPGGQSAIWEEAIGCGLPLLINVTEIKDAPYYDRGGNVIFTKEDTAEAFIKELDDMISTKKYKEMAYVAETKGRDFFSYERISEIMLGKE